MSIEDQIIGVESGGNATATNPNSSASGLGQFIDSTWLATLKQHRPDLAAGKSDADLLALKTDPNLSRDMTAAYAADNQAILAKNGVPVTAGTTYLAHFAGPGGAVKVLQADPSTPVSDILGPAAVKANPFLQGMTAQGLQAWAARKMGVQTPQTAATTATASPGAPTSLAPPQSAPIFANSVDSSPMAAAAAPVAAPAFASAAPVQSPIFAPPQPRRIDLSGLRAALAARAPIFSSSQG